MREVDSRIRFVMGTRGPRFEQGPETVPARASGKRGLEAFDRLPPGSLVGEYEIVEVVAHGGMSTVYRAVHPLIGKEAAVKVMAALLSADQVAVSRFLQEARIVARIRHPNVVDVFSFGTLPDGRCYLVMEWIGGETLAARLSKRRLRPNEIAQTLGQICDALEVCHEQGVVHRDLKPANVFLAPMRNRPDFVKLVDFGIAKLIAQGTVLQTSPDVVLGTPGYASPEQAGGLPVGRRPTSTRSACWPMRWCSGGGRLTVSRRPSCIECTSTSRRPRHADSGRRSPSGWTSSCSGCWTRSPRSVRPSPRYGASWCRCARRCLLRRPWRLKC